MDTFTATKVSVVGPYDDSVSIGAFGPVGIEESAIDAAGDIAGSFTDETGTHAVLERGGSTTIFDGAPGAQVTSVVGFDPAGDVIGTYELPSSPDTPQTYVYRDGTATTVGPSGWTQSYPTVINAVGTFAGFYTDAAGDHAFIDNAGVISSFDAPAGDFAPTVDAIDANGDVAGIFEQSDYSHFQVYLDQNGKLSTVALPSDTEQVGITGVDPAGSVIGYYFTTETSDSGVPAYFIANPGSTTDPGPEPIAVPAGGTIVNALGFDPQGDVVGTYYDPTKGGDRIFRTDALGVSTPVDDPPGATSTDLSSIAPDGTLFGEYTDATGTHLFSDRAGAITTIPNPPNSRLPDITGEDAAGDVIGEFTRVLPTGAERTFLFKGGTSTALTLQGRPLGSSLLAIDAAGDIVGTTEDADGDHMFVDKGGTVTTQDAAPGAYSTTPVYVDNAGDIIGQYIASDGGHHFFVDKDGTFTTVDVPAPAGFITNVPTIEAADSNGDFAGQIEFDSKTTSEERYFAYIDGNVTVFDLPSSVGIFPEFVGMDPQGDIGIEGSGPLNGQVVSSLRMADGSYQAIVVPGSVADSTELTTIDRAGNLIGTYQTPSAQGGAPVTRGFVRLAASGAYVAVAPPAGVNGFSPRAVDAAGDVFGTVTNSDYTSGIFEQKAGAAQGAVVDLGSGTGRENLVGVDAAGDIAANAYTSTAYTGAPTRAFLVIGGRSVEVKGSSSATSTTITNIDAAGDIVGTYTDAMGTHNFASFAGSAPRISNTHASGTSGEAPVPPFAAVTVQDLRDGGTDVLTIALSGGGGTLADGAGYGGASTLKQTGPGTYTLTGAATGITAELDALSFTPTAGPPGTPNPTTFTLTDASSVGGSATETVTDSATVVTDTAANAASTGAGTGTTGTGGAGTSPTSTSTSMTGTGAAGASTTATGGAGTSAASVGGVGAAPATGASDSVSFQRTAGYRHGTFTLGGQASSAAGVTAVEISAVLSDGTRHDLGAATVHPDGTFTFADAIGADQQSFIEATLTDGAGARTVSPDPLFSLASGLGPNGGVGRQTLYTDGGDAQAATILSRPNGLRAIGIESPGQTMALQPYDVVFDHRRGGTRFVYTPGTGTGAVDTVRGFRLGGPDHDTLALPSADFANLAAVLRNTGDVNGSAFITDPETGDAIRLAGVTTAELKAHPKDIALQA